MTRNKHEKLSIAEKRLLTGGVLLAASAVLTIAAGRSSRMAEWYSAHIYPLFVGTVGRFAGVFSFSLSELALYVLIVLLAGSFIHAVASAVRNKCGGPVILQWASGLFLTVSVLVLLYVLNCGINYRRVSFSEKSDIQMVEYTVEDLKQTCMWLTEELNARTGLVNRDEAGVMKLTGEDERAAVTAMEQLGEQYPALSGYYPQPKSLLVSEILSWQGITGIYSPFTVEANYNEDMTAYNIPFTACHELSHLRGFMQEEEANFIAFLACKDAAGEDFQYSGYLMGWIYSTNALKRMDAKAADEVRFGLNQQVETDLKANSRFWNSYEGTVAEVSNKVNDTYLKVNGQSDGVQSYDRMVDLIVSYHLEKDGIF
ncbi:DUF3810 domain-containing protein [Clostridium sp. C105KSO13]|uniref:DUF3810 domain-containing protein n=1 Tax=Clostridium sp. C105KSO13 TaxID=1776045 RepID=UPI00074071BB|nr:DUF3810 domain-containing protein [Clostridium sp. C105KSO13]CUX21601.1 hypothetical protein BN3456_00506 [Clostridium sp. C105KSO13]